MKILVPVKRVIDYNVKVRVKPDQSGVELANVKMAMNPFDEIAVEQALRIKEAGQAEEVVLVSVGPQQSQETIRTGLAMGADRGIHIEAGQDVEPLAVAKLLTAVVGKENPSLVLCGKQAIDDDSNQTAQMLSALLGWSQATFASGVELAGDKANIIREVDGGLEHIEVSMPAVISVDLRLNEPRYVKLPDIMKAKKKPLETIDINDLSSDTDTQIKASNWSAPEARAKGVIVNSVDELVAALKEKGLAG